jgi:hypothetical protein
VPSIVNDTLIHHQAVTIDTLFHVVTDDVSVSSMVALATLLIRLL